MAPTAHRAERRVFCAGVVVSEIVEDATFDSHQHDGARFSIVLEGAVTETSERGSTHRPRGSVIFTPPHFRHATVASEPSRVLSAEIPRERFLAINATLPIAFDDQVLFGSDEAPSAGDEIHRRISSAEADRPLKVESAVLILVAQLSRALARRKKSARPAWLDGALSILRQELCDAPSPAFLARRVGVTEEELQHALTTHERAAFPAVLLQQRIECAQQLLRSTSMSAGDVADAAGFYDHPHMWRVFQRRVGCSPNEYRQRAGNAPCAITAV